MREIDRERERERERERQNGANLENCVFSNQVTIAAKFKKMRSQ